RAFNVKLEEKSAFEPLQNVPLCRLYDKKITAHEIHFSNYTYLIHVLYVGFWARLQKAQGS
ncbi:MAG: hypothetical protein ACOVRN_11870, partial [Flavobacterium sp.]